MLAFIYKMCLLVHCILDPEKKYKQATIFTNMHIGKISRTIYFYSSRSFNYT